MDEMDGKMILMEEILLLPLHEKKAMVDNFNIQPIAIGATWLKGVLSPPPKKKRKAQGLDVGKFQIYLKIIKEKL